MPSFPRAGFLAACLVLLGGAPLQAASGEPPPAAQNRLQAVDYATLSGGRFVIRLRFVEDLAQSPAVFTMYHPQARLVLDFARATSGLPERLLEVGHRGLRSLQVVEAGNRLRLIVNLGSPATHELALSGRELLITLNPRAARGFC